MLNWLLICVPLAIGLEFQRPESHSLIFLISCLAIVPLAGWLGRATEQLAHHTGEGAGGLLNATFGNAAELIIAIMALKQGLYAVVKASLTGSIIGNVLLVLGASVLAGGIKYREQKFNATAARMQSTMLLLAAIAMVIPAAFHAIAGPDSRFREDSLSFEISLVLLLAYAAHLVFSLYTHKQLFGGHGGEEHESEEPAWSLRKSVPVLLGATALIAWVSEILVGSVEQAAADR
jgi:Ca2+:H+ antiporter